MKKNELAEIEKIVEEFTNLLASGKAPPMAEFLKRYPKLEAKLRTQLETVLHLTETAKAMPEMAETLKQKLHNQFWSKVMAKEKKRLLTIKKRLIKESAIAFLPIKQGVDFLLLLLHGQGKEPNAISGITRIMKLLFLFEKEAECDKYCSDYYQFIPYKLGPFAPKVYEDLKLLIELGFVEKKDLDKDGIPLIYLEDAKIDEGFRFNEVTTVYTLTELGNKYAQALAKGLAPKLLAKIRQIKMQFSLLSLKELLSYVYHHYPEYTTHSEILKELLR